MSDLQLSLILLGVLLILLVLLFNWWQDRRIRRRMQEHFPEREQDPLMGTSTTPVRREPGLGVAVIPNPDPDEPMVHDHEEIDPTIEAVIEIKFGAPVDTTELFAAVDPVTHTGTKPVRIFAESDTGLHRSALRPGESYVSLQLAVLMANRSGPLTAIEWSRLWATAQEIAQRFDGAIEGPEQDDVLARAQALDTQCAALDAQVGLVLRFPQTQDVAPVMRVLEDSGFIVHGRHLAWMSEQGQPRFFALLDGVAAHDCQDAQIGRIDLLLDLPNSPQDEQAFSRMASVGRDLARRLGGDLLDDQGNPVADQADATIDKQLSGFYRQLNESGFPAGESRTLRVFS